MEDSDLLDAFRAIGQRQRLRIIRLLLDAHPQGLAAGEIGRRLGLVQNTLSSHLAALQVTGFISGRRTGRLITYTLDRGKLTRLARAVATMAERVR